MKTRNTLLLFALILCVACTQSPEKRKRLPIPDQIKAFCIDFNWSGKAYGGFSMPEDYNMAEAQSQFEWYKDLGVNTIQSFCVSHNGYAWYDSKIAPKVPGLKGNFLKELVDLGHKDSMLVMGYFSPGANDYWRQKYPEESYHDNTMFHVIYTKKYLEYLGAVIREAVSETGIDGFMIDAIFAAPGYTNMNVKWLDCEKEMYTELFDEPFIGIDNITPEIEEEFMRRSMERCWDTMYTAAKSVDPEIILWICCHDLQTPQLQGSKVLKQIDWLMNEGGDTEKLKHVRELVGDHTRLIQGIVGHGNRHNAAELLSDKSLGNVGFYGFAWPDLKTAFPPTLETAGDNERFIGNAKNIEATRKFYLAE